MNDRLEILILFSLFTNEQYTRKVLPHLQLEYFSDFCERKVFEKAKDYVLKYNNLPTKEAILIEINNNKDFNEEQYKNVINLFSQLKFDKDKQPDVEWLIDETESWCQQRALNNALITAINEAAKGEESIAKGGIPKLLSDALAVSFDSHIGHDYIDDFQKRYEKYHHNEDKIPFDLDFMNKITKGGVENKTLNIIMAGINVGKSLFMCHLAATNLMMNKNVLYITLEMAEEKIAERIDANLLKIPLDDLVRLSFDEYQIKIQRNIKRKTTGKLVIKEYPTAVANCNHFRHLLTELKMKKSFVPDIIYIDYLNIAASSRYKAGSNHDSYTYNKAIAEEIRGMAVEYNVPIWTATQVNRKGFTSSNLDMDDVGESFGIPATADFMIALNTNEQLEKLGQIIVTQVKSRYGDKTRYRKFPLGIDKSRMRLFDLEESAHQNMVDTGIPENDTPVFDNSVFGRAMKAERREKFKGIDFGDDKDDK